MRIMKRTLALLLSLTMLMSLLIVPANAADEDVVLKITPDKTSINTATAQDVTYTISVEVKDSSVKIGGIQFTLDAPSGVTVPKTYYEGFWTNEEQLKTKSQYGVVKSGIFETFEYTFPTQIFIASGTTDDRNLHENAEIMKIKVSVAENTTGSLNFTAKNVEFAKVDGGAEKWTYRIDTTAVEASSATSTELPVAIPAPVTGGTPETAINGTNYTGSITWTPTVTGGKFAASTEYTANVTLTAKDEYKFASGVKPIVAGADKVENVVVGPGGSTLTFNAKFPKTGTATLKDILIPELTVAVPTAKPDETQTKSTPIVVVGVYDDPNINPTVAATLKITTAPIPDGVSLEGNILKVTNKAEACKVRVLATFEGKTDNKEINITKEESKATAIVAAPPATGTNITIPNGGTNTSGNCSYKVYDQYGAEMTGASATWKMEPETVTGVTFVPANGSFSVNNTATTCTVKLHAEIGAVKSNEITFHITREESKPHLVTITGVDSMNVPIVHAPGADGWEHKTYTAEVKDQYNNVISNPSVEWSVTGATGVSIDKTTGKLTVSNKANAGTVTITAKSGTLSATKTVTINKDEAKATLVEIFDQAGEGPKNSIHIPTGTVTENVDYTAKVYDQYGVYMPTEMVQWALDPTTVAGVELDDTTISGSATLKVGNTATSGTTFKLKATTATPGTSGVKKLDITLTSKTPASVTTTPKAVENLKYTGDEQALVTEGAASGGTMKYSLNGTNWTDTVPTGKNAGTYTVQYKVVGDSDHTDYTPTSNTVSVSIGQKEVTVSGITAANKVYDGKNTAAVNADGATFTGKVDSDELTITATGTFADADVDVGDDKTVTLTLGALGGTSVANYTLATEGNQTTTTADITRRDLTVKPDANLRKKFGAEDPTLNFLPTGAVDGQTPDFTGALSRAEGEAVGQYDITLGDLALKDNGAFKASNYTLKMDSHAEKFEITKADALTLKDITVSQKYTVTTEQSKDIGRAGMPEKAGTLAYAKGTESKTGSVKVDSWSVDSTTGKVSYKLSNGAAGDTVTLPVTITSDNYENSIVYVKIALTKPSYSGGGSYTPSYTVSVDKTENGTITISPKSASKGDTVTITVKPDKGYELDTLKVLDKDGDKVKLTEKNGKYTFKMPSGKVTVKGSFVEEAPVQIFKDVPTDAYYYEAVKWAAEKGITGGVGNKLFAPNQPCTRAQIVTFLWRAAGSPAPKSMSSFADVPADAFYAKAVAWAVENGITGGTGDGKFSPDATCTRAQSVTFLYRAAGSPKVSSSAEFGDVATNAYYADAVAWAAKNGITGGIGGGLFGSNNDCTRAQIVTFLYRCVK